MISWRKLLEVDVHVEAHLEGVAALCYVASRRGVVEGEDVVSGIGDVACPEVEGYAVGFECCVGSCYGIELLFCGVCRIPVNLALSVGVGTYGERLEEVAGEVEAVVEGDVHLVGWYEGYSLVLI